MTTHAIVFDLNQLRRGSTYRAVTSHSITTGEYLGIETAHGDRAVLLRHRSGTASIAIETLTSIASIAA